MATKGKNPKATNVAKTVIQEGKSVAAAMREEGYSASYANSANLQKTKTWIELMDKHFPEDMVAETHKDLFKAKKITKMEFEGTMSLKEIKSIVKIIGGEFLTVSQKERKLGNVVVDVSKVAYIAVPDKWSREKALEKAYKLRGNYAAQKIEMSGRLENMTDAELQMKKETLKAENALLIERIDKYGKEKPKAKRKRKRKAKTAPSTKRAKSARSGRATKNVK